MAFELEALLDRQGVPAEERPRWRELDVRLVARAGGDRVLPLHVRTLLDEVRLEPAPGEGEAIVEALARARMTAGRPPSVSSARAAAVPILAARRSFGRSELLLATGGLVVLSGLLGVGAYAWRSGELPIEGAPRPPDLEVVNADAPGEERDLEGDLVPGKLTLVEFYSDRCGPSRQMSTVLDAIAAARPDLAVRKVDIDREDADEIDFDSPLAEQYEVHATPYFRLYAADGALLAEGDEAKDHVRRWYHELQLGERAEQVPEISERYRQR